MSGDWETGTGLLDDVNVTIEKAIFTFDTRYNNGQSLILLLNMTDENGEEHEQFLPCGNGWEPAEKGAKAVRENGKDGKFNRNTAIGTFIEGVIAIGAADAMGDRGSVKDAATWIGTRWHLVSKTLEFTIDGEKRETTRVVPDEYLGSVDADAGTKPAKAEKAKSGPKAEPEPEADAKAASSNGAGTLDAKTKAKLTAIAKASKDHNDFMEKAFGLDEVLNDPELSELVAKEDGFYAEAIS